MNSKTLLKFHKFGKVGKIIMNVLTGFSVLLTVMMLVSTIAVYNLPKDALTINVTSNAEFKVKEKKFDLLWGIMASNYSYSSTVSPESWIGEDGKITPPENQDLVITLSFFDQSYSSANIHTEGDVKVIEATSSVEKYSSTDLVPVLLSITLLCASAAVVYYMSSRLFATLEKCDSPFCDELVGKMKKFAYSLLPLAVFSTISDTLTTSFLTAGKVSGFSINTGILAAFVVTMLLVTVFKYGIQLQKESDETL